MDSLIHTIFFSSTLELFTEEISVQTDSRAVLCEAKGIQFLWVSAQISTTYCTGDKMNHLCFLRGLIFFSVSHIFLKTENELDFDLIIFFYFLIFHDVHS